MSELRLLTVEEVEEIHDDALAKYGGLDGLRDRGLLESAVAAAGNVAFYEEGDVFEVAATYAFHIAENQPYLDGNKRTAVGAALLFLRLHRVRLDGHDGDLYDVMVAVAEKTMKRSDLGALLRSWGARP